MAGASGPCSLSDDLFGPYLFAGPALGAHPTLAETRDANLGHSGNKLQAAAAPGGGGGGGAMMEGLAHDAKAWQPWGADAGIGDSDGDPFNANLAGARRGGNGADGAASSGGRVGAQSGESSGRSGEVGGGSGRGGAKANSPPGNTSKSFKEIHAERNKQAQRRFRQRQKVCVCPRLFCGAGACVAQRPRTTCAPTGWHLTPRCCDLRAGEDGGTAGAGDGGAGREGRAYKPLQDACADAQGAQSVRLTPSHTVSPRRRVTGACAA